MVTHPARSPCLVQLYRALHRESVHALCSSHTVMTVWSLRLSVVARTPRQVLARAYSVVAEGAPVPGKRKVWDSADEAVKDVKSGSTVLSGGVLSFLVLLLGSALTGKRRFWFVWDPRYVLKVLQWKWGC